jgi:proteic killer suppression protein
VIESFSDKAAEKIWKEFYSKRFPKEMQRIALRKLIIVHRAKNIDDLRTPPGNRLEQLSGDRKGQYSIRINNQWRICFYWNNGSASEVEITDYY